MEKYQRPENNILLMPVDIDDADGVRFEINSPERAMRLFDILAEAHDAAQPMYDRPILAVWEINRGED